MWIPETFARALKGRKTVSRFESEPKQRSGLGASFTGQSLPIPLSPILGRNLARMSSLWPFSSGLSALQAEC